MAQEKQKKSFKDTLNLPTTDFPIRPNHKDREPELVKFWQESEIYNKSYQGQDDRELFVLHDGPPYANGHLHIGHALNKTLKDIVCKVQLKEGKKVHFKTGWDCHGLPIELKVSEALGFDRLEAQKDRVGFKKKCREFAQKWIDVQKEEFQRLGIIGDFTNYYSTMSFDYEASILRALSKFVSKDLIYRRNKTVPWCSSCETVLATAEIEYQDRKDPSIFVFTQLEKDNEDSLKKIIGSQVEGLDLGFVIWTTTPWTLPLNRALILHPDAEYSVIAGPEGKGLIVGSKVAEKISTKLGLELKALHTFSAKDLEGFQVHHPVEQGRVSPVVLDDMVLVDDGTAVIHCAPGCGPEDYLVGIKNKLEIFSPVSSNGSYTDEVGIVSLAGMPVSEGQWAVLKYLKESGKLLHKENLLHSYPHCWRCHNGLIFRATKQWFCDLSKGDLAQNVLKASKDMSFYPDWGRARLESFIGTRTEWCISRQRIWGVPIASLICGDCDNAYIDEKMISSVAENVEKEGIEFWDRSTVKSLQDNGIISHDLKCSSCSSINWKKEEDILDVWFDSGVSSFAVLQQDKEASLFPADLYLEGSDQHRGWFQSSSLCSMVVSDKLQTKSIFTHGYVLDKNRHKMSKSKGNVTAPQEVIEKYGADVLRLWAAVSDRTRDIVVSEELIKSVAEMYRKIRNTCRFLLSNLYDFDQSKEKASFTAMDRYVLSKLALLNKEVRKAYLEYDFTVAMQKINNFCINDLSAGYLDMIKDRLYVEKKDGKLRTSSQQTCSLILETLTNLVAPVLSFLAEDVFSHKYNNFGSVFSNNFVDQKNLETLISSWDKSLPEIDVENVFALLEKAKSSILKLIEVERESGKIKHSLESNITLCFDSGSSEGRQISQFLEAAEKYEGCQRFLKDWFIVSQLKVVHSDKDLIDTEYSWLKAKVDVAIGIKCPRCWQWDESNNEDGLCSRCLNVL